MKRGTGLDTAERVLWRAILGGTWLHQTCEIAARFKHYPGHVNVGLAAFDGLLGWDGVSFDADYDLRLYPVRGGVTNSNPEFIHVEFDSDETLNQFDLPNDSWWRRYRAAALHVGNTDAMTALLGGNKPDAVIGGLLGFDCEHDCHSELHPVYVLAIRETEESHRDGKEHWAIMARNWGTEGWCSSLNHVIGTRVEVTLPYPAAPETVLVTPDGVNTRFESYESKGVGFFDRLAIGLLPNHGRTHTTYSVPAWGDHGVYIRFDLPESKTRTVVLGEAVFTLSPASVPGLHATSCIPYQQSVAELPPDREQEFESLVKLLPPDARPTMSVAERHTRLNVPSVEVRPPVINGMMEVSSTIPPVGRTVHDREKLRDDRHDEARRHQVCVAAVAASLCGSPEFTAVCGLGGCKR